MVHMGNNLQLSATLAKQDLITCLDKLLSNFKLKLCTSRHEVDEYDYIK